MARAKQTARAEARRRHRQANRLIDEPEPNTLGSDSSAVVAAAESRGGRPSSAAASRDGSTVRARPSFLSSFRGAYHPVNLRADLAVAPQLLLHWTFLGSAALIIAGAAAAAAFPGYDGSTMAFNILVVPGSAILPPLLIGLFAPRASYLLGFLIGVIQALAYAVLFTVMVPGTTPGAQTESLTLLGYAFLSGPVSGLLFASAAAWYRRFLALSSPRKDQAQRNGSRPRPTPAKVTRR